METNELLALIARGEDSRTQFKRRQDLTNAKSLAGELVAFSNSRGGKLIVGVDDDGAVAGLAADEIRQLNQLLANTAANCVHPAINPETENVAVDNKVVMVITVREGISKPYADQEGVFWVKSGADKRRVTAREEIRRMFQEVELVHADGIPVMGAGTEDLDLRHFDDFFVKRYGATVDDTLSRDRISLERLLNNLGLAREAHLTLAGLLLFGKRPQRHRPAFLVKAVSFVGNDLAGVRYRDSEDIDGCFRDLYKGSMSFITRNLRRRQGDKNFNSEGDLEISRAALEELVVNMLLHRDYFIPAPWRILIFDNRIELISPGALPNNLTVENVRNGVSLMRNPLIASFATKELPYRGLGTGILRALAVAPELELESDRKRNLFIALIPRARVE